jgi:hypothetical protein
LAEGDHWLPFAAALAADLWLASKLSVNASKNAELLVRLVAMQERLHKLPLQLKSRQSLLPSKTNFLNMGYGE